MLLISRRHVRFVDRWWSDNFLLFGGDVIFVTIDRVVVFGDERGDEERFGFPLSFGARKEAATKLCSRE